MLLLAGNKPPYQTVNLNLKKRKEKFNHELSTDVIHTVDFTAKTVTCFQFKISGALSFTPFCLLSNERHFNETFSYSVRCRFQFF